MLVGKTYTPILPKQRDYIIKSSESFPSQYMSLKFNNNIKRPSKNNSQNLSFEGLSLYKQVGKFGLDTFEQFSKEHIGGRGKKLLDEVLQSDFAKKNLFKIDGNEVTIQRKTVPHLIWDGIIYPLKVLPGDILNGIVSGLRKVPGIGKTAETWYNNKFFQDIRMRSKIDNKADTLRGLFETQSKLLKDLKEGKITKEQFNSQLFEYQSKSFNSKAGNYDTKHERALVRIVSGMPPAIFLANDAYNLSRMMDDDHGEAKKEKKTRFRQEVNRVGLNAYITLVTLGALQKFINNSVAGTFITTFFTTLFTESYSRLKNGKHISRLTPEQARAENIKNKAQEAKIKPDMSFKADPKHADNKEKPKPLLSFNTLMKASAVVIAAGFGIKALRKNVKIDALYDDFMRPFNKLYKKWTEVPDYKMELSRFNKIVEVLEENGFNDIAEKYRSVALHKTNSDGTISLGKKDKKIKPLVNFIRAPFKFVWSTVTLPYRFANMAVNGLTPKAVKEASDLKFYNKKADYLRELVQEATQNGKAQDRIKDLQSAADDYIKKASAIEKKINKIASTPEEIEKEVLKNNIKFLSDSIEFIGKQAVKDGKTKFDAKQFEKFVTENSLKGFNEVSRSKVSNADLANLAKVAGTAATLWFLMTDNYNMVMLKSNGNDKDGADTKFKERFVQEGSRLFYQTLLIDLFNSTFSAQYNKSLLGASWITMTNTTLGEILTRKSVGVPITSHTRDELVALEDDKNNATGFLKGYYNFMQRLTGKRDINSYCVKKNGCKNQSVNDSEKRQKSESEEQTIHIPVKQPVTHTGAFHNSNLRKMIAS